MKNGFLIFIESNTSGTGRLFVKAACDLGYRPVLLVADPGRYEFIRLDSVAYVQCDTSSQSSMVAEVAALQKEAGIAGIFSSSEYFIEVAALLASAHGLPGENPLALRNCRNKAIQRQYLQKAGLRIPRFECVNTVEDAILSLQKIPFPVVVKPTMGSGSVGVRLCYSATEVADHASALLRRKVNEKGLPLPEEVLIEEYLVGPEFSVETLGQTALGITRKHVSPEPFFVELGHDFPAGLSSQIAASMVAVAQSGLCSLGLGWGPAHVEIRLTNDGPTIIEINPRLAGGFIPEIVRLALGVDVIRETVKLVAGEPVNLQPAYCEHASIRFLTPKQDGVITAIQGLEEAATMQGVVDIQAYRGVGDQVGIRNDFRDRIGHVISRAELEVNAAHLSEAARNKISFAVQAQA
jgi:S-sulfo-L-cysteine synthase (3-phospho-L-serine-dependent)